MPYICTPKINSHECCCICSRSVDNKERIQSFKGDVVKRQGEGGTATFTVRKISDGVGVERLFPVFSPSIESIKLHKVGKVRRSKLYFLRERSGKSARIKEKRIK